MTVDLDESRKILHAGFHLPECPRWRNGALYFSDMYGQTVYRLTETGELTALCTVAGRPGGLGFAANGDLLVCEMERARILRLDASGALSVHADLSHLVPSINDMVTSADGRCYVGRLTMEPPFEAAPLLTVDPAGRASIATQEAILVANGMVLSRDGRRLIVAESAARRLLAYDIDARGGLSNHRVFADLPEGQFPDGLGIDAQDGVWNASPHPGRAVRVLEGGEVTHRVTLEPGRFAYACAVGGADGRTVFLCTSGPYQPEIVSRAKAGRIETVRMPAAQA